MKASFLGNSGYRVDYQRGLIISYAIYYSGVYEHRGACEKFFSNMKSIKKGPKKSQSCVALHSPLDRLCQKLKKVLQHRRY